MESLNLKRLKFFSKIKIKNILERQGIDVGKSDTKEEMISKLRSLNPIMEKPIKNYIDSLSVEEIKSNFSKFGEKTAKTIDKKTLKDPKKFEKFLNENKDKLNEINKLEKKKADVKLLKVTEKKRN